jgi:hypothetical protein
MWACAPRAGQPYSASLATRGRGAAGHRCGGVPGLKQSSHLWQEWITWVKELRLPIVLVEAEDVDRREVPAQAPAHLGMLADATASSMQ